MNNLSLDTLLPLLQRDFFMRVVLASVEVIRLLHTQDSILHESFGVGAGGDRSSGADLLAESIFSNLRWQKHKQIAKAKCKT